MAATPRAAIGGIFFTPMARYTGAQLQITSISMNECRTCLVYHVEKGLFRPEETDLIPIRDDRLHQRGNFVRREGPFDQTPTGWPLSVKVGKREETMG